MLLLYLASLFRVDAQPKTPWHHRFTCLWLSWEKKMQARKEKGLRPPFSPRTATTSLFRYPSDHVMVKEKVYAWGGCWQSGLAPKKGILDPLDPFVSSIDLGESLRRWRKQCSSGEPFFFFLCSLQCLDDVHNACPRWLTQSDCREACAFLLESDACPICIINLSLELLLKKKKRHFF